jgi:elongation factor Ts
MEITAQMIKKLREETGAGIMDCKDALRQTKGDIKKAIEVLQKKGAVGLVRKKTKVAKEGLIHSYIHGNGRIGVLLEINCETDFVARTKEFKDFADDIAMQIAALAPQYIASQDIPQKVIAKQQEILESQLQDSGKPQKIIPKIVQGRIKKWLNEICLLNQPFIKDQKKTIEQILNTFSSKVKEKIVIQRFVRYELGEKIG